MTTCPLCRQEIKPPKEKREKQPARPKVRIRIDVPVDERENGFEVFHSLLDECAGTMQETMGYTRETPAYFVLTAVMAAFLRGES